MRIEMCPFCEYISKLSSCELIEIALKLNNNFPET